MELAMHFIFLFSCSFTVTSKQTASTNATSTALGLTLAEKK